MNTVKQKDRFGERKTMQDLYHFLTKRVKAQGMRQEEFAKKCKFSHSSLYRYMKGIIPITADVEDTLANTLHMNDEEREQFRFFIGQTVFDKSMLRAREELDTLVFGPSAADESNEIEIVLYDGDKYLRTFSELTETILSFAQQEDFCCRVQIFNGIHTQYFSAVAAFLHKLLKLSSTSCAEQLLTFSESDYQSSIISLIRVLPLLQYENYSLYYNETSHSEEIRDMFPHFLYFDVHYQADGQTKQKYYMLSFLQNAMPECIAYTDPFMHRFIMKNYTEAKQQFKYAIHEHRNIESLEQTMIALEESTDIVLLKPNHCYNKIPLLLYQNLFDSSSAEEKKQIAECLARQPLNEQGVTQILEDIIEAIRVRIEASYQNRHIDVYSLEGLRNFAKTGRLSDHLAVLPSIKPEERRICLEYIRDRNNDPNDSYRLYITEQEILKNGYIFSAYQDTGVLIEYNREDYCHSMNKNLFLKNKTIASIFFDYVENQIPLHALSKRDATAALDELIAGLN